MDLLLEDAAWVSEVNSPVTFNKSKCWAQSAESTALRVWTRAAISTTASVAGVLGRLVILIILSQDARFKAMAASLPTPHPTPPHPRLCLAVPVLASWPAFTSYPPHPSSAITSASSVNAGNLPPPPSTSRKGHLSACQQASARQLLIDTCRGDE